MDKVFAVVCLVGNGGRFEVGPKTEAKLGRDRCGLVLCIKGSSDDGQRLPNVYKMQGSGLDWFTTNSAWDCHRLERGIESGRSHGRKEGYTTTRHVVIA